MSPERVLSALEVGTMAMIGLNRSLDERRAIASFVTGKAFGHDPAMYRRRPPCAATREAVSTADRNGMAGA